ncbi:MAG: MogA/MoaB family molybdenum cofactor biosynthesis protein [Anaerolineales bacterium]|nr:MogA/MoaB family molybdenum cofactor biosynthesis protein [Anaerolineales bacterium]
MTLRFGIVTVSDRSSAGLREDLSGPALHEKVTSLGWQVVHSVVIPDDLTQIQRVLREWCDKRHLDVLLTTGGTGFSPRDVTPEATQAVIERLVPGIAEAMRASSRQITPHALLSRAVAGIRKQTLIINLPGSPKGALENLQVVIPILPHAVELLRDSPSAEAGHAIPRPG